MGGPQQYQKASVRDTVTKLQEQSRRNGGGYATNQFSSVELAAAEGAGGGLGEGKRKEGGMRGGAGMDESDEER